MSAAVAEVFLFISHSGPDTWVARQISHYCQRAGAKTFLDEADIHVGADFEVEIRKALERATELLVLMTPWASERLYVWTELAVADFRQIPLVTVLHGLSAAELQKTGRIPVFLKRRNMIDINGLDRYFDELKRRVDNQTSSVAGPA